MSTYTRKKCPHCHKTYESYSTYTKQYSKHSGCPFLTCGHCGQVFVDTDIKEPALSPPEKNRITIVNCFFGTFMPFGLGAIFSTMLAYNVEPVSIGLWIFAIALDLFYVGSVVYFLVKRDSLNKELEQEYKESYERLQNPEYARALQKAGFDVPYCFLQENH